MTRDELWDAYEAARLTRSNHYTECGACRSVGVPCPTWKRVHEAWQGAREAWESAPSAPAPELALWQVKDLAASYGDPEEVLIMATDAVNAERWFMILHDPAPWHTAQLETTRVEWPPPEGILLTSHVEG